MLDDPPVWGEIEQNPVCLCQTLPCHRLLFVFNLRFKSPSVCQNLQCVRDRETIFQTNGQPCASDIPSMYVRMVLGGSWMVAWLMMIQTPPGRLSFGAEYWQLCDKPSAATRAPHPYLLPSEALICRSCLIRHSQILSPEATSTSTSTTNSGEKVVESSQLSVT